MKDKLLKGFYNWTILAIVFVAIVLVNVISSYMYKRFDMTEDQRYSLAESTVSFLNDKSKFKGRINIKIYLAGALPAELEHFRASIEDKLKEFKEIAGDRIEYQFIDPKVGTDEEVGELENLLWDEGRGILPMNVSYKKDGTQSQMRLWPGAIIEYGGGGSGSKVQTVQFLPGTKTKHPMPLESMPDVIENATRNLEYTLMSSLRRIIQEYKPRIGFLQGHGELSFAQTQRARALISPYFSVGDVELNDSIHALDGYDGLIIARPTQKFSDRDLYLIDQFVMKGGRLMCFVDRLSFRADTLLKYGETHTTRIDTRLEDLLFDYGLKIEDNYVLDANCMPKPVSLEQQALIPWFYHVMATPTSHPISRNVEPVSLKYTSEIKLVPRPERVVTPILTSSTNSTPTGMAPQISFMLPLTYVKRGETPKLVPNPKNEANKKCLAGLAEGSFESRFKNRLPPEFANAKEIAFKPKSVKEGKVFVVGNGRLFENRYDSMPSRSGNGYMYRPKLDLNDLQFDYELAQIGHQHIFGNQEFFQNLCDYMMGDNSILDIRSRQIEIHKINSEKVTEEATFYKILNVGLPIVLILILAVVMHLLRRRKFAD